MRAWSVGLVAGGMLASCDPSIADYCAPGTKECTPLPDAGRDGSSSSLTGADGAPGDGNSGCDPEPAVSLCGVNESRGVFVAPTGSDTIGSGTRASPYASITHALTAAKGASKNVYVCAGMYTEQVELGSAEDGVGIYGGLDCVSWSYAVANRVRVVAALLPATLAVEGLAVGTSIEDLEFDAQNVSAAASPGTSSVAAFVRASENVSLTRVTLVAGNGNGGAAGTSGGAPGPSNWDTADGGLNGASATSSTPGPETGCTCPLDTMHPTAGGAGGGPSQSAFGGTPVYEADAGAGAPGVVGDSCGQAGTGQDGLSAPALAQDSPSTAVGSISTMGWVPGTGTSGSIGRAGQGGGGGGNGAASTGFGGGGACGGCGGAGGAAGFGGGGSIALVVEQSSVSLTGCTLTTAAGGPGGPGGNGEAGQLGGVMGGNGITGGCAGGAGGAGAGGNGGQGGPGGVSLGIAYTGTAPTVNGVAVASQAALAGVTVSATMAAGGAPGVGGAAANAKAAPGASGAAGIAGASQAVLGL